MTQVDFYILGKQSSQGDRFRLTCRLVDKAFKAGHRVCINTESGQDARHINDLLWTFNEKNFIPHDIEGEPNSHLSPVKIFTNINDTEEHDILINLAQQVPQCFSQFNRLLEPVDQQNQNLENGRHRYRYYRDCGYEINNHDIN